jgi:hypothetical protein
MQTATGVIARVDLENRRFVLRPNEGDRVSLRFRPETIKVVVDGKEAKPEDMQKGQRAEIEYVVRDDRNIARTVKLQSAGTGG